MRERTRQNDLGEGGEGVDIDVEQILQRHYHYLRLRTHLSGLLVNPFLPWFALTVLAIAAASALLTGLATETFRARPLSFPAFAGKVIVCGIITGILSAVVSAPVVVYLFGGVTGSGSASWSHSS